MRTVSLLIFLLGFHSLLYAQGVDQDCLKRIRTGTFYVDIPGFEEYSIVRTKKKQVEHCVVDGKKAKIILKVKWLDDYTYTVKPKKWIGFPDNYPINYDEKSISIIACKTDFFLTKVEYKGKVYEIKFFFSESE